MYKEKTIVAVVGKTCSGKSYMTEMYRPFMNIISIDDIVYNYNIENNIDTHMLSSKKLVELEVESYNAIRAKLLYSIENCTSDYVIIDGIQAEKLLGPIIDTLIIFKTTLGKRQEYSDAKGWSRAKFNMIDKLQVGIYD